MPEDDVTNELDMLLSTRGEEYGDAWILTTEVLAFIAARRPDVLHKLVFGAPYLYAWITILCKLLRVIQSPTKADSWRDVAGYATLVAEHIETGSRGR